MTDPKDRKPDDPMAGIHWNLDRSLSYGQYLQLDKMLNAQKLLSGLMNGHLREGGLIVAATHVPLGLDPDKNLHLGGAP